MQLGRPSSFSNGVSREGGGWYVYREMQKHCSRGGGSRQKWTSIHGVWCGCEYKHGVWVGVSVGVYLNLSPLPSLSHCPFPFCSLFLSFFLSPFILTLKRWYCGLVDCALYFTHTYTERGPTSRAATTLLLDQSAVRLVEGRGSTDNSPLADVLSEAQLNGIPIETAVNNTISS